MGPNSGVKTRDCASQKAPEGNDRHTDTHTHTHTHDPTVMMMMVMMTMSLEAEQSNVHIHYLRSVEISG